MAMFEVEYGNERILPNSGIALAGAILKQGGFRETMSRLDVTGGRSGRRIKDGDLMSAYVALCRMGKPDFEAIRETDYDPEFYALSPGADRLPSEAALRRRMDKIGESKREAILKANAETLRRNGYAPADMDAF